MQQTKMFVVEYIHLAKDALHIYAALIIFFGSCLVFGWRARQWKPWLVTCACALLGEIWDIRDSLVYDTPIKPWANWKDIWNTMLWPSLIMTLARYTRIFGR
jgi:hypothetical protein